MDIEEVTRFYWEVAAAIPGIRPIPERPPTSDEIAAVEAALGVRLPASVHYFLLHSPHGTTDFTAAFCDPRSIVWNNREFHKNEGGYLPPFLLMWSGGHDGDCTCFDTRFPDADGEYPIVYWDYDNMTEEDVPSITPIAMTFPQWLNRRVELLLQRVR